MTLHQSIIKTLRNGSLPVSDLQSSTQVSLPTLRKALQELADARWVRVVGQSEANGGRPAMLYGLDDSHYLLVGLHLQLPGIQLIASDLAGNVLDVAEDFSELVPRPEQVIGRVEAYLKHVQTNFPERVVLGIGIASPGFTEPALGHILSIERVTGWQNVPICQHLSALLNIPVTIANDVDCMAFAEFQHTGISLDQNLAYVGFDEGVKVSLFLNGQLYQGSFGNAGLIVTDLLNLKQETTFDLGEILTIEGINHLFQDRLQQTTDSMKETYGAILATQNHRQRFSMILKGAADGLPICQQVVSSMNAALAVAIANIIYVVQPDMVFIGGLLTTMPTTLFIALVESIRQYLPALFRNRLIIRQAMLTSPYRSGIGANYHFLETHLNDSSLSPLQLASTDTDNR